MSPVRVLSVLQLFRPAFSGEGEWWLRMVPYLRRRGVGVSILTSRCHGDGDLAATEVVEGVEVHRVGAPGSARPHWSFLLAAPAFLRRQRRRFDVVLFHGDDGDVLGASVLLGKRCGWKTVYKMTLLSADDPLTIMRTGRLGRLRLRVLRMADGYISISGPLTRAYAEAGLPREKLLVTSQGVEASRFAFTAKQRMATRAELGIPAEGSMVLFVGSLLERKGVDILVEAWRRVVGSLEGAVLMLVGPNANGGLEPAFRPFAERIAAAVRSPEFRDTVRLVDYTPHVDRYYSAADLFVFPSRREGFGAVITEAMAASLPCVVSELNGIATEVLTSGWDGVIVQSQDPAEYAFQIHRLLKDRDLATEMGRRARARVLEQFSLERVADAYAAFFAGLKAR